jgi:hypothetical protein
MAQMVGWQPEQQWAARKDDRMSSISPPDPAPVSAHEPVPAGSQFTPIEMKVLTLAAQTVLQGRPCAVSARFLRRFRSTVLGERPPNPLADPRLEALRRLACYAFASGGAVSEREAGAARDAGISQAQVDGIVRMVGSVGRRRDPRRRLLRRRRAT